MMGVQKLDFTTFSLLFPGRNKCLMASKEEKMPEILPVFPLQGIILLPRAEFHLNVFEPRYLAMVDDVLGGNRLIGLVQPKESEEGQENPPLYKVGCAGRIISFAETQDDRYLLTLRGLCRFETEQEIDGKKGFRRIKPDWRPYRADMEPPLEEIDFDLTRLVQTLRQYFKIHNITADPDVIFGAQGEDLVSSLSMLCPLPANEKQALLEAPTPTERAKLLTSLLEMACMNVNDDEKPRH